MSVRVRLLFVVLLCLGYAPWGTAQSSQPQGGPYKRYVIDWSWLREKWTGDSTPYRRILEEVRKLGAPHATYSGSNALRPALDRALKDAQANPKDTLRIFRAAAMSVEHGRIEYRGGIQYAQELSFLFRGARTGKTPEYARIRAFVERKYEVAGDYWVLLKRLYERDPDDALLLSFMCRFLAWELDRGVSEEWLKTYGERLWGIRDRDAGYLPAIASFFEWRYHKTKNRSYGERALTSVERWLAKAPADHKNRKMAAYMRDALKRNLAPGR